MPDRASTAGDEHGAAGERARGEPGRAVLGDRERAVRGDRWHAERRTHREVGVVRQGEGALGGHDRVVLGGSAARSLPRGDHEPDAVADGVGRDAGADGVDDARAILVRY